MGQDTKATLAAIGVRAIAAFGCAVFGAAAANQPTENVADHQLIEAAMSVFAPAPLIIGLARVEVDAPATTASVGNADVRDTTATALTVHTAGPDDELTTGALPREHTLDQTDGTAWVIIAAASPALMDEGNAEARNPIGQRAVMPMLRYRPDPDRAIIGIASFYDDPQQTASGEQYDPNAFTAAAQLEIRDQFGGIRFGKNYQMSFGLAEYEGKKVILKFNDVGPLRPGRKFDLSRAAMAHFGGLEKGLLPGFKVTPLPLGQAYSAGPVTDEQLAAFGIDLTHPLYEFAFDPRPLASVHAELHPSKVGREFLAAAACQCAHTADASEAALLPVEVPAAAVSTAWLYLDANAAAARNAAR